MKLGSSLRWSDDPDTCLASQDVPVSKTTRDGSAVPSRYHLCSSGNQAAASFSFFSGRTLTFTEAGLAANHCSSLVNGLMPLRLGLAGTLTAVIFSRPGRVNEPAPFLLTGPCTAPSSDASTARTSREATPVASAMCATRPDLVRASLIGFGAAGLAAAFFGAACFVAFFFAICVLCCSLDDRVGNRTVWNLLPGNPLGRRNVGQVRVAAKPRK